MSPAVRPANHETTPEEARRLARLDEEGHVFALAADGGPEQYVGQYLDADPDAALRYFTRKFDELYNRALLLHARAEAGTEESKTLRESLGGLQKELDAGAWVGDVAALRRTLEQVEEAVEQRARLERADSEQALQAHLARREEIVFEAEQLAAVPAEQQHWKRAQARMDELFESWKAEQKRPPRLSKAQEDPYWKRFRGARTEFDKARRAFFGRRDKEHAEVKRLKEELITRAEELQHSTDFGPTTKAYHRLMDEWKAAGRGARKADDAQWGRFRAAQDVFFAARDAANAQTDAEYAENLKVKEEIIAELEALMPFDQPERVRDQYHVLLERWDAAGKVPRTEIRRMEGAIKRVQDAFRQAEQSHWRRTDPETQARQSSMLTQLDEAIAELEQELEQARSQGDETRAVEAAEALAARRSWQEMLSQTD